MSAVRFPVPPGHSPLRRRILQGTLAAGALTLAPCDLLAKAGVPLYKLPRHALVIGNSTYADAPLANPANDARAVAGELRAAGFEVSVRLNASRDRMLKAIEAFRVCWRRAMRSGCSTSPDTAWLAWHNYLLPVDAEIRVLDDIPARGSISTRCCRVDAG